MTVLVMRPRAGGILPMVVPGVQTQCQPPTLLSHTTTRFHAVVPVPFRRWLCQPKVTLRSNARTGCSEGSVCKDFKVG